MNEDQFLELIRDAYPALFEALGGKHRPGTVGRIQKHRAIGELFHFVRFKPRAYPALFEATKLPEFSDPVALPDGGFMTAKFPLPENHWLTAAAREEPPMPWRIGKGAERHEKASQVTAAARYAIRASTMNGTEPDFDPDAMVQNFVVGMLGYWTEDGLSHIDGARE